MRQAYISDEIAARIPAILGLEQRPRHEVSSPMTMHHIDVSPRFGVPADDQPRRTPSSTRVSVADPSVCEWAVDLTVDASPAVDPAALTSLAAACFVDFDAIETVHISDANARRA